MSLLGSVEAAGFAAVPPACGWLLFSMWPALAAAVMCPSHPCLFHSLMLHCSTWGTLLVLQSRQPEGASF
jgi:hypothetical protein